MTDYFARMRQLIGTTAEWAANDLVIGLGEFAIEIVGPLHNRLKMGDGTNRFSALPYYDPGINSFVRLTGDTMTGPLTTPELHIATGPSTFVGPATFTGAVALGPNASVAEPPLVDQTTRVPTTHWVANQLGVVITGLRFLGGWNASTNSPTLQNGGAGTPPYERGDFFLVSVTGTTNLDGITTWNAGDTCAFNGVTWQRLPQTLNYEQIVGGLGFVPAAATQVVKSVVTVPFSAGGIWTPNAAMLWATIEAWGGGGAGGGTASASTNTGTSGGGGAAGSWSRKTVTKAQAGTTQTVTIGAGGAQTALGNNAGAAGGDTTVGTLVTAKGGGGGPGQTAAGSLALGGLGVVVGNVGDVSGPGMSGQTGSTLAGTNPVGGGGGSAIPIGTGGRSGSIVPGSKLDGEAAIGFASGGAGGHSWSAGGTTRGGAGTGGYVVITEYRSA